MRTRELYIDRTAALEDFVDELDGIRAISVDTEFIREKTYFPLLCLVQVATPATIACIDCLAEVDAERLFERLLDSSCEWIIHSSRQDLEVVYQHASRLPERLVDTQVAAGLVGYAPQIGLQNLLSETLGIELPKDYTRTDWSRRPLPEPALQYARDDVRNLEALWSALSEKLDKLERRDWVAQDCALLTSQEPLLPPTQIWLRMRGLRGLDVASAAAALALVEWREARARARDRPRRWILADEHLIAIAKRRPPTANALRDVPNVPARTIARLGPEIVAAVSAAESGPQYERASMLVADEPPEKQRVRALRDASNRLAEELGIYPEVLATKQELNELLMGRRPPRIAATWRADFVDRLMREL